MKKVTSQEAGFIKYFVLAVAIFLIYQFFTDHNDCSSRCNELGFSDYEFSKPSYPSALQTRAPKRCYCLRLDDKGNTTKKLLAT